MGEYMQNVCLRRTVVHPQAFGCHGHGTAGKVGTHGFPVALMQALGQMNLANHGRQHMAVFQVEVVIGAIQVGGHHCDIIGAVL